MTAKKLTDAPSLEPVLLTVKQLQALTGYGRNQVYELIHSGQLGHIQVGKSLRVPRGEFDRWVANAVQRPVAPSIPFSLAPKRR